MAEDRPTGDHEEPTLELPKLFGRTKKRSDHTESTERPRRDRPEAPATTRTPAAARTPAPAAATTMTAPAPAPAPAQSTETPPRRRKVRPFRLRRPAGLPALPDLDPRTAAGVTGLIAGVVGCLLTYLGLRGCELLGGTSSCGGPGLLVLVVILGLMVLTGAVVLAAWKIREATSTSFLGVGITTVVGMVALLDVIFSGWMFLVVPVVSAAAFAAAHWVTTRLVEQPESGPGTDVR